jgi:hypothetical protein
MTDVQSAPFSVASLFAERDARRRADQQAAEDLSRREQEELAGFKQRLETFQLTQDRIDATYQRIRRAFDRAETEIMISSFPSEFCSDSGRAINNADLPSVVKPSKEEAARLRDAPPVWLATLPAGVRVVYDYWKAHMQPQGFVFAARVIDYPDGKPGNVGLFISWPKNLNDPEA